MKLAVQIKNFIMTFDDGYKDMISNCLPLLKNIILKPLVFLFQIKLVKLMIGMKKIKILKPKKLWINLIFIYGLKTE